MTSSSPRKALAPVTNTLGSIPPHTRSKSLADVAAFSSDYLLPDDGAKGGDDRRLSARVRRRESGTGTDENATSLSQHEKLAAYQAAKKQKIESGVVKKGRFDALSDTHAHTHTKYTEKAHTQRNTHTHTHTHTHTPHTQNYTETNYTHKKNLLIHTHTHTHTGISAKKQNPPSSEG